MIQNSRKCCSWPPGAIRKLNRPAVHVLLLTFQDVFTLYYYSTLYYMYYWLFEMFLPYTIVLPYTTIKFFIYCLPYTTYYILTCMLIQELRVNHFIVRIFFLKGLIQTMFLLQTLTQLLDLKEQFSRVTPYQIRLQKTFFKPDGIQFITTE